MPANQTEVSKAIAAAVADGMQLATALQTFMELAESDTPMSLDESIPDINATASALAQLGDFIVKDKIAAEMEDRPKVFSEAGYAEVLILARKCHTIYKNITALVHQASGPEGDHETALASDDPSLLTPLTILRQIRWDWLDRRLEIFLDQLEWLKLSILLHIQMANVAKLHLSKGSRPPNAFDQELAFRAAAEELRMRGITLAVVKAKKIARKQEKVARASKEDDDESQSGAQSGAEEEMEVGEAATTKPGFPADIVAKDTASTTSTAVGDIDGKSPTQALEELSFKKVGHSEDAKVVEPEELSAPAEEIVEKTVTTTFSPRLSRFLPDWMQKVPANSKRTPIVPETTKLEVWVIDCIVAVRPVRVPLSQEQLRFGLGRAMRNTRTTTWFQPSEMTARQWQTVNAVLHHTRTHSSHTRTCVGMQESRRLWKGSVILVFFELGEVPAPVILTSPTHCRYQIPYEHCREFDHIRRLIQTIYNAEHSHHTDVMQGKWDLFNADGQVILPGAWKATVQPGDKIEMRMATMHARPPMIPVAMASRPPPPRPRIFQVPRAKKYPLTDKEKKELGVVDFVAEAKLKDFGVPQLLGKFTNVVDVGGSALQKFSFARFAAVDDDSSSSSSDSDSDSDSDTDDD